MDHVRNCTKQMTEESKRRSRDLLFSASEESRPSEQSFVWTWFERWPTFIDWFRKITHFHSPICKDYTILLPYFQRLHTFIGLFATTTQFYWLIFKDYTLLLPYFQRLHTFIALFSKITHFHSLIFRNNTKIHGFTYLNPILYLE